MGPARGGSTGAYIMKNHKNIWIKTVIIFLTLNLYACGFSSGGLRQSPGYANLHYPSIWEADRDFSLSLGPTSLGLIRLVVGNSDKKAARIIGCINGVRITTYKLGNNHAGIIEKIYRTKNELSRKGWQEIISVDEENEHSVVLVMQESQSSIDGVVFLSIEGKEATFINLIGDFEPEYLAEITDEDWISDNLDLDGV